MDLEKVRKRIDLIDSGIMQLLNERMEIALSSKKFKEEVQDLKREKNVINNAQKWKGQLIDEKFSEELFKQIIDESKKIQEKKLTVVSSQGEHGSYSEQALRNFNPSHVLLPFAEFNAVFEAVENEWVDLGIVPIENSVEGAVNQVNDLLIESNLKIVAEINMPINHCLLTLPETNYQDVKIVYSHPQALAQCRGFLLRNKLQGRPFYDTAGAAKMLIEQRPKATAVIASRLCTELYNLEILKETIEDNQQNSTRFVVIAKEESKEEGNKCSIAFTTKHKAGALFNVLKKFSEGKINLTRIESRPIRNNPGDYAFLLDFQGSNKDVKINKTLEEVKEETEMLNFLGCYKEAIK